MTVIILVVFYSAPLSVLAEVFATQSSASLYLPFAIMNMVNGLLWTVYGAAVPDAFIYGPNMVRAMGAAGLNKAAGWLHRHTWESAALQDLIAG